MRAPRRHAFNCTFEAVECHASLTLSDNDGLVIVVAAHITLRHISHLSARTRTAPSLAPSPSGFRRKVETMVDGAAAPLLIATRHCSDSGGHRLGRCRTAPLPSHGHPGTWP